MCQGFAQNAQATPVYVKREAAQGDVGVQKASTMQEHATTQKLRTFQPLETMKKHSKGILANETHKHCFLQHLTPLTMQKRNHIAIYNVSALRPSNKTQMHHYLQQVTPSILQNTLNVVIHEMPALMRCNKIRNTTNHVFSPFQRCSKIATYHAGATISRPSMQPLCYLPHCRQNLHMFLCETLVFCIYGHQQLHIGHARTFTFAKLKPQSPYVYI